MSCRENHSGNYEVDDSTSTLFGPPVDGLQTHGDVEGGSVWTCGAVMLGLCLSEEGSQLGGIRSWVLSFFEGDVVKGTPGVNRFGERVAV